MRRKIYLIIGVLSVFGLYGFIRSNQPNLDTKKTLHHKVEKGGAPAESRLQKNEIQPIVDVSPAVARDRDYYEGLPDFSDVIRGFEHLTDEAVDKKIAELEDLLKREDLVNRANEKKLDDQGFRHLAQILQRSDALYHIKTDRQLESVEQGFTQVR